ncbi:MAG: cupin domain-containing protein [Flavobacteriaceae bacterium]|nr:cupin domain-containing protein [Flavobacteriaceae bacterium]NNK29210.1 cupin domain-containing protein [Flavobacteriaceae bacterium]
MEHNLSNIVVKEIISGFRARFVHSKNITTSFVEVDAGSLLPLHSHVNEQISIITEGKFEMTIDGITNIYETGMVIEIPPNVEHSGKALTDCKITDIFYPVREDYKS